MKPKLHLRRVRDVYGDYYGDDRRVTHGKVYKVVRQGKHFLKIIDDNGNVFSTGAKNTAWQRVWVWPNGTEVDEL
jgi:hypothetical protein